MTYRSIVLVLLLAVITVPLASQGTLDQKDDYLMLTDGLGRTIALPEEPERIVLAGRANLFLVDAVYLFSHAPQRVIAVAETDQGMGDFYPLLDPGYREKERLPNSAGVEQILSLQPDMVIIKDSMYQGIGRELEQLSVPVLTLGLESYDEYLRDIELLGTLFGEEQRADELIQDMTQRVETASLGASREGAPEVLMLYYTFRDGTNTFHIPPADWIQTFMTETAGAVPLWSEHHTARGWQAVNFEQIAQWDPEMIFLISYTLPSREVVSMMSSSALWQSLQAVEQGNLLPFPGDFHSWAQSDIRWLLGQQWLAAQLHPDLYADLDMEQEVIDFYEFYLSVEPRVTREHVLPLLQEDLPGRR